MRLSALFRGPRLAGIAGVVAIVAASPVRAQLPAAHDSIPAADTGTAARHAAARHDPAPKQTPAPLEGLAAKPVLVLPVQYVSFRDTLGWSKQMPPAADCMVLVDSVLTETLHDRGLKSWRYAEDITRAAKRNAGLAGDPHDIAAIALRFDHRLPTNGLGEPLASQLRSLIALNDARMVLIPVELRTVNVGGKAVLALRLVVIDARGSVVAWAGAAVSSSAATWSPELFADLAEQVAALIVPAT